MPATVFEDVPAEEKVHTRDGRQWTKDVEFCDGIRGALKSTFDGEKFLKTTVIGKTELRKIRGALRYFAAEQGWGISLKTVGDESETAPEDEAYTVTFRAQEKREAPLVENRKVRRRNTESDEEYAERVDAIVREANPKNKGERADAYEARIDAIKAKSLPVE